MSASVMEVEAGLYGQDGFNGVISNAGMVSVERCYVSILYLYITTCVSVVFLCTTKPLLALISMSSLICVFVNFVAD